MTDFSLPDDWEHAEHEGLIRHLGGLWQKEGPEGMSFGFIADEMHSNRYGVVHGGMMMTVIDRAFGTVARQASGAKRTSTVSLNHQFLSPLKLGSFATVSPRLIKMTSRLVFLEGTLIADEAPILHAQGIWRLSHSNTHESLRSPVSRTPCYG